MDDKALENYIGDSLKRGQAKEKIFQTLLAQGWTVEAINIAFAALDARREQNIGRENKAPVIELLEKKFLAHDAGLNNKKIIYRRALINGVIAFALIAVITMIAALVGGGWSGWLTAAEVGILIAVWAGLSVAVWEISCTPPRTAMRAFLLPLSLTVWIFVTIFMIFIVLESGACGGESCLGEFFLFLMTAGLMALFSLTSLVLAIIAYGQARQAV